MYNAEVLSKFPVVQHFPFGSLFRWDQDPKAPPHEFEHHLPAPSTLPLMNPAPAASLLSEPPLDTTLPSARPGPIEGAIAATRAPWAHTTSHLPVSLVLEGAAAAHSATPLTRSDVVEAGTKAPWVKSSGLDDHGKRYISNGDKPAGIDAGFEADTKAPWASSQR